MKKWLNNNPKIKTALRYSTITSPIIFGLYLFLDINSFQLILGTIFLAAFVPFVVIKWIEFIENLFGD